MKLKALSRGIAISSIFLFLQCQSEEMATNNPLDTSQISIRKITEKEIPPVVLEKLNKITSSKKKLSEGKTVADSINNFYIQTDTGKYLQKGDYHSYTFRIHRFLKKNLLENLVLSIKRDGTYKATIASYHLTSEEKNKLANGKTVDLTGKTAINTLENFNSSSVLNKEIYLDNNGDCWSPIYGTSYSTGWDDMIIDFAPMTCPWANNGGSGGSTGSGSGGDIFNNVPNYGNEGSIPTNTGNTNTNPQHGGSGGGSDNVGSDFDVITTPVTDNFNLEAFNLTPANESWFVNQPFETQLTIFNYLSENDFSSESIEVANEMIDASIDGTAISLSPFFKYPKGSNYATIYPKLTAYLKDKIPNLKSNQFIINKLVQYSELSQQQIISDLQWNNGPTIEIVQLDNFSPTCNNETYGIFSSASPNTIYLDVDFVNLLENSQQGPEGDSLSFLLGVTTLHEYVHLGDFVDGIDQPGEEGILFEEATYGESIWVVNAEGVLIKWQH